MSLTLAQLLIPLSVPQCKQMLLSALQGLGVVLESGVGSGNSPLGTGSISLSGTPTVALTNIIIKITTNGELGVAVFQYSLDNGVTFTSGVGVPAAPGTYNLSTTGVVVTFVPGPLGAGISFVIGDQFNFATNIPSLPVTAWGSSGGYRQLVEVEAQALAAFAQQQPALAAGGYTPLATGSWCDLIGNGFYQLGRNLASPTQGLLTLTDTAGAGPFIIAPGTMWFATGGGLLYSNLTGGTLPLGGTLQITIAAEFGGSLYNVGNDTIQTIIAGSLPRVTVDNPDPGSGTWITSQGSDNETDSAYMLRCQQRWPALGTGSTLAVYQLWATSAEAALGHSTTITKVLAIVDSVVPGQVDVFLAGASGASGVGAVADAVAYITPRIPLTATANIVAATNVVMTLAGVVNYRTSLTTLAAVQAAISAALAVYFLNLAIGSDAAGANSKVYYTAVEAIVGNQLGVRNLVGFLLNGGTADIGLIIGRVATLTNSLTFTAVP
jgi:hypothetical protein